MLGRSSGDGSAPCDAEKTSLEAVEATQVDWGTRRIGDVEQANRTVLAPDREEGTCGIRSERPNGTALRWDGMLQGPLANGLACDGRIGT